MGRDALSANHLVHLHLSFVLRLLKVLDGLDALLAGELSGLAIPEAVAKLLDLVLVNGAFVGVHHVHLHRLFKNGLGHLDVLVEVGLDDLSGQLLPVCGLENQLLAPLDVLVLDSRAALDGVLGKAFLGEVVSVLYDELA